MPAPNAWPVYVRATRVDVERAGDFVEAGCRPEGVCETIAGLAGVLPATVECSARPGAGR